MRLFQSQRDLDRSNNVVIGRFFQIRLFATLAYGAIVAGYYLLGWW